MGPPKYRVKSPSSDILSKLPEDNAPKFMGFNGPAPMTAEEHRQLPLAIRSVLNGNNFTKVDNPTAPTSLYWPTLNSSEELPAKRWCIGLCGDDEAPKTSRTSLKKLKKKLSRANLLDTDKKPETIDKF